VKIEKSKLKIANSIFGFEVTNRGTDHGHANAMFVVGNDF
jgi:hypothetical protein